MSVRNTDDDYERIPGLYEAWDFGMLLEDGRSYRVEDGGRTQDGQRLYMVFQRPADRCGSEARHDL